MLSYHEIFYRSNRSRGNRTPLSSLFQPWFRTWAIPTPAFSDYESHHRHQVELCLAEPLPSSLYKLVDPYRIFIQRCAQLCVCCRQLRILGPVFMHLELSIYLREGKRYDLLYIMLMVIRLFYPRSLGDKLSRKMTKKSAWATQKTDQNRGSMQNKKYLNEQPVMKLWCSYYWKGRACLGRLLLSPLP